MDENYLMSSTAPIGGPVDDGGDMGAGYASGVGVPVTGSTGAAMGSAYAATSEGRPGTAMALGDTEASGKDPISFKMAGERPMTTGAVARGQPGTVSSSWGFSSGSRPYPDPGVAAEAMQQQQQQTGGFATMRPTSAVAQGIAELPSGEVNRRPHTAGGARGAPQPANAAEEARRRAAEGQQVSRMMMLLLLVFMFQFCCLLLLCF